MSETDNPRGSRKGESRRSIRRRRTEEKKGEPELKHRRITKRQREQCRTLVRLGMNLEEIGDFLDMDVNRVAAALKEPRTGRPPVQITESDLGKIEVLAGIGLSQEKIAAVLGIAPLTFSQIKQRDPEVEKALSAGIAKMQFNVGKALVNQAQAGNISAIIWYEKTRAGYSDRLIVENKVKEEVTALFDFLGQVLDEDTYDRLLQQYDHEFCGQVAAETEGIPEVYR